MAKTLEQRERKLIQGLDPIERARRAHASLADTARNLRTRLPRSGADRELCDLDAFVCEEASALLQILGIEVTRLRLAIQHFDHGRMDRFELREIPKRWNGDPPEPPNAPIADQGSS